jgi:predicted acetyltransferase
MTNPAVPDKGKYVFVSTLSSFTKTTYSKKTIEEYFTALHYEAQDYGETEKLETMETELQATQDKDIKKFIIRNELETILTEYMEKSSWAG